MPMATTHSALRSSASVCRCVARVAANARSVCRRVVYSVSMPSPNSMSAPSAVPAPIIARLAEALKTGVGAEDVQARYRDLGIESTPWSPAEFQDFVRRENAEWRPLIRELGIRLDS